MTELTIERVEEAMKTLLLTATTATLAGQNLSTLDEKLEMIRLTKQVQESYRIMRLNYYAIEDAIRAAAITE